MRYDIYPRDIDLFNTIGMYMFKMCKVCNTDKAIDSFYKKRVGRSCIDCLNKARRNRYKLSTCRYCSVEFRPDVEGRYKFCSDKCRFFNKVIVKDNDCWVWKAGISDDGYGKFVWGGKKNGLAHRFSFKFHNGNINEKLLVLHSCHKPLCVNPDHLRQGSDADNTSDRVLAGRNNPLTGEDHPKAKLNERDVMEIRRLSAEGISYSKLAKRFNVTDGLIGHIVRRISWKHI